MAIMTLLLMRHGQSIANAIGQFTGWTDVGLTAAGEDEARRAGELIGKSGVLPEVVHTSVLRRSIHSADILLNVLGRPWVAVSRSWRLNERQYGALAGRDKRAVREQVGEPTYRRWRRSPTDAPPPMAPAALEALRKDPRYARLPATAIPATESLLDVAARVVPYWVDILAADVRAGRAPLVVAHGSSLRALCMHLDALTFDEVEALNMPTGIPIRYEFDERLNPLQRGGSYLDPDTAEHAAAAVAREGMVNRPAADL